MLRLLSLLQLHRHWPGPELADRLEVSERTVRRDIDRLRSLGYPVESVPGATGGYQMAGGSTLPPMVFDHEEAVALARSVVDQEAGSAEAWGLLSHVHEITGDIESAIQAANRLLRSWMGV